MIYKNHTPIMNPLSLVIHSLTESIQLKIKRTAVSKRQCNYPDCWKTSNLKEISKELRLSIIKDQKIYVPQRTVACELHLKLDAWKNAYEKIELNECQFTSEQLEEMFHLLTNTTLESPGCIESRMY